MINDILNFDVKNDAMLEYEFDNITKIINSDITIQILKLFIIIIICIVVWLYII